MPYGNDLVKSRTTPLGLRATAKLIQQMRKLRLRGMISLARGPQRGSGIATQTAAVAVRGQAFLTPGSAQPSPAGRVSMAL